MRHLSIVKVLVILGLIVGLSGCQLAQNVTQLLATPTATATSTATPTATETATDTATVTSTATATEVPTATETPLPTATATPRPLPAATKVPDTVVSNSSGGCSGGNTSYESSLLAMINQERANNGVGALSSGGSLISVARDHSMDMALNNYFDHNSSSGSPFDRMQSAGISFTAAAENLYAGNGSNDSPSSAFAGWMASEGHRTNMLDGAYTSAGVGYWCDSSSTYGGYFTLDLIHP